MNGILNNHPNRNWRAAMRAQFQQWLAELQSARGGIRADLIDWLRTGYQAGYADGRASVQRKQPPKQEPPIE